MSKNLLLFSVMLPCVMFTACAANLSVKAVSGSQVLNREPSLSVQSARNYTYDYDQVVAGTAYNDVYVICRDCASATRLDRELGDVPISVFWGKEKFVSATSVSQPGPAMELSQSKPSTVQQQPKLPDTMKSSESAAVEKAGTSTQPTFTDCVFSPILFDFDSAVLKESEKEKVMTSLGELRKAKDITVKGFTCDLGSKEHNDRLALERAQAVAVYLEEQGIGIIRVVSEGKCCYVSEDRSKNRRAEIYCLKLKGEKE